MATTLTESYLQDLDEKIDLSSNFQARNLKFGEYFLSELKSANVCQIFFSFSIHELENCRQNP